MKTPTRRRSGFALLAAIMVMALLAIISIAVLTSAGASRRRAIRVTRGEVREGCAYAGLNYARNFFSRNFANWNTYLATPNPYNPNYGFNQTTSWASPAGTVVNRANLIAAATGPTAPLAVDLDADADPDVYIFIRDNMDEFDPAPPNFSVDNDQNVIVGAICISNTMQPRREDDHQLDPDFLVMEAMLSYNQQGSTYGGQATGGASGTGNLN